MKMRLALVVNLGLAAISGSAHAQSTLDKYLKKNTQAVTASNGDAGINKVFQGPDGFWRLDDNRANGGSCSVTYVSGTQYAGYVGPSKGSPASLIVFGAPTIPPEKSGKNAKMTLMTASDGKTQDTQAFLAPNTAQKDVGIIIFRLTGIQAAVDELSDVETINVVMNKKQVFSLKWQGGNKARAALQKCLSGPVGAPQPTSNIAANASEGRSTITGTAYAKVALIAPRQYAPKGWDVGLVRMTEEMKQWMADAQAQAATGLLPEMPAHLKSLFRTTKIEDNKGNFRFTNLLPGDYALRVSFNYNIDRKIAVSSGYMLCQGSNCYEPLSAKSVVEKLGSEHTKFVSIKNNSDTVTMDLAERHVLRKGSFINK